MYGSLAGQGLRLTPSQAVNYLLRAAMTSKLRDRNPCIGMNGEPSRRESGVARRRPKSPTFRILGSSHRSEIARNPTSLIAVHRPPKLRASPVNIAQCAAD